MEMLQPATGEEWSEGRFMRATEALQLHLPGASSIAAALLVAVHAGLASDSRTFARMLGLGHAPVLREITNLEGEDGPIIVTKRDARTQRTFLGLSPEGIALLAHALANLP